jgi:hypothetical protein
LYRIFNKKINSMAIQNLTDAQTLEKYRVSLENVEKQSEIAVTMAELAIIQKPNQQ